MLVVVFRLSRGFLTIFLGGSKFTAVVVLVELPRFIRASALRKAHGGSQFVAEFVVKCLWCAVFQARMRNFWKFSKAAIKLAVLILLGMTVCPMVMGQRMPTALKNAHVSNSDVGAQR